MNDRDDNQPVLFDSAWRYWVRLGFLNFGGPAGQIAMMHRELVMERGWISELQFLRALNFCTLLPGPEAQQLATYIGWRMHGVRGGLVAGLCFILPGALLMVLLSWVVAVLGDVSLVRSMFYGIQPVVVAIVLEAVLRVGRRTLTHPLLIAIAASAFVALAILHIAFPLVVLGAAFAGSIFQRWQPAAFAQTPPTETAQQVEEPTVLPTFTRNLRVIGVFLLLWIVPIGMLVAWRGPDDVLTQLALFFTRAAFVTFGGAYAVLSYVADVAVTQFGWLSAQQMIKGLALAETTPGPLILVTQYVGYLGAYQNPGGLAPEVAGLLGALITTYCTFLPCFFFVFLGAPYIEALSHNRHLHAALTAVTAAVVGVILNLTTYVALHTLFPHGVGWTHIDLVATLVVCIALVAFERFKLPIYWGVLAGAVLGIFLQWLSNLSALL